MPKGEVTLGFYAFVLDTRSVNYPPVDRDLLIQHLRTNEQELITATGDIKQEHRLEDHLVRALIDFNDIPYDDHSNLLYDLAGQMVQHLFGYLHNEDKVWNVLAQSYGEKPWRDMLIPHDIIAENMAFEGIAGLSAYNEPPAETGP